MNEHFLSYLWKYRHLDQDVETETGDLLAVIHPGDQNSDSGPDFFNARLRIGDTTWAGNVEIHVQASDWYRHGHDADPAYDRVILHVVYEADRAVFHQNGEPVQTVVVRERFPAWIFERYQQMMQNRQWIPCMNQLHAGEEHGFSMWASALAVERLEFKATGIRQLLRSCGDDWEEAIYLHLGAGFGFKINSLPFELLAKSLPLKIARQHCGSIVQLEALLFGQAGMLERDFADSYPLGLAKEYDFLRGKYRLEPITGSAWKFLRLRPSNFPTIRISQFAGFLLHTRATFFHLVDGVSPAAGLDQFKTAASEYWNSHYVFDKPSSDRVKIMGNSCVNLLAVNGLIPFLFFYGLEKGQPSRCEAALEFLEQLGGEENGCIDRWKEVGFPAGNALQTQALIHLKQAYCDKRRCLECRVGSRLLAGKG